MATLVLAKTFLPDYADLEKPVRAKVDELFAKFSDATQSGLHLEKYAGAADKRARTIRVDKFYRGIVAAPEKGDTYILTRVLTHDDADKWMMQNTFSVNEVTGALEIANTVGIEAAASTLANAPDPAEPSLFESLGEKHLRQLGVDPGLLGVLKKVTSVEELDALTQFMPEGQSDALHMLAAGYSVDEAWSELVANEAPSGEVDTEDLAAAAERTVSQSMFYVVQGQDDLVDMLNRPFDLWRTFLHPTQRRYASKDFNGPARVTGGAGTGKTVIAMHRARALAERLVRESESSGNAKVLLTTFTTSLADELAEVMATFCSPDALRRIDVLNVDKLAHRVVSDETGRRPKVVDPAELDRLWADVVDELGLEHTKEFVRQEWEQVVIAQGIRSRADYFTARRAGRGIRLSRRQRADVWRGVEAFTNRLLAADKVTFLQLADLASEHLGARSVKPYAHVVLDEAQDLHPAQWRMLRAAVDPGVNDLFIVGDTHQRVYDNRVSLSKLGIEVRGRSHRLRINYRTTHEILRWALSLLTGETFDDLDDGAETLAGYRSTFHGPPPELVGYTSQADEVAGLVAAVKGWVDGGLDPGEVGVAARTKSILASVEKELRASGIPARQLEDGKEVGAVAVGTMHRMKGMEFRAVAVVDAGADRLPLPFAVTQASVDQLQHDHDVQRERCLVYVACTRARDTLRVSWTGTPSSLLPASE
jgi:superfamily I DNA/RNA helicase